MIEAGKHRAALVHCADGKRAGKLNGVIGTQAVCAGKIGRTLDGGVGDLDNPKAWGCVGRPRIVGGESADQEQHVIEVHLACALLAPERGGHLRARERRDEQRRGQSPDLLVAILGDVQLDERGGVGEDAQPRSSLMIEESVRPRAARLPAAATAAGSGRG